MVQGEIDPLEDAWFRSVFGFILVEGAELFDVLETCEQLAAARKVLELVELSSAGIRTPERVAGLLEEIADGLAEAVPPPMTVAPVMREWDASLRWYGPRIAALSAAGRAHASEYAVAEVGRRP